MDRTGAGKNENPLPLPDREKGKITAFLKEERKIVFLRGGRNSEPYSLVQLAEKKRKGFPLPLPSEWEKDVFTPVKQRVGLLVGLPSGEHHPTVTRG